MFANCLNNACNKENKLIEELTKKTKADFLVTYTNLQIYLNNKGLLRLKFKLVFYDIKNDYYLMVTLHIQKAVSFTGLNEFTKAIEELNTAKSIIDSNLSLSSSLIDLYYQYYKTYQQSDKPQ